MITFTEKQNRLLRSVIITEIARELAFLKSLTHSNTWSEARISSEIQIAELSACLAVLVKEVDNSEPIPLR